MSDHSIFAADLNLLPLFQVLMRERSISAAARKAGLSQPAMSRALQRLRVLLNNELLVRSGKSYEPTCRAVQVYATLEKIFPDMKSILNPPAFDPKTAAVKFRLAATDYSAVCLLPSVIGNLRRLAPSARVELSTWSEHSLSMLESNTLDTVIWINRPPEQFQYEILFQERFAFMIHESHPILKSNDPMAYFDYDHIAFTSNSGQQILLDTPLEALGYRRKISVKTHLLNAAVWLCQSSDLILTLGSRLAEHLKCVPGMRVFDLPVTLRKMDIVQVWHPRLDRDPAHLLLRKLIRETAQNLENDSQPSQVTE